MLDQRVRIVAEECLRQADPPESAEAFLSAVASQSIKAGYIKNPAGLPSTRLTEVFSSKQRKSLEGLFKNAGVQSLPTPEQKEDVVTTNTSPKNRSLWKEGVFFLFAFVTVIVVLVIAVNAINPAAIPVVIIGGVISLLVIGIFVLRRVDDISSSELLKAIELIQRYLPFLPSTRRSLNKNLSNKSIESDK